MVDQATNEAVASILLGVKPEAETPEDEQTQDTQEAESATEPEPDKPADEPAPEAEKPGIPESLTVKQLAERLEVRPQDVYGALRIDVGGDTMTLSELKDRGKDLHRAEKMLSEADEHRTEVENDLLRRQRAHAVATGGREYSEDEIRAADRQWQDYVASEDKKLKAAISSWSDPAQQQADEEAMTAHMGLYGFSEVESGAIRDHRLRKLIYDHSRLTARLKAAEESEVKPKRSQPSKAQRKTARKNATSAAVEGIKNKSIPLERGVAAIIAEGLNK